MPIVEAFDLPGCRCWFYSDDHGPAHFHAKAPGEWEIRIYFLSEPPRVEEIFSLKKIPGRIRRELLRLAHDHRGALLREWSEKVHRADEAT